MPPITRESSTGVTRQDSLPPTESQEAAEALENMALSEEEEPQCEYIKPNEEQCLRAPQSDSAYCWQHARMVSGMDTESNSFPNMIAIANLGLLPHPPALFVLVGA